MRTTEQLLISLFFMSLTIGVFYAVKGIQQQTVEYRDAVTRTQAQGVGR